MDWHGLFSGLAAVFGDRAPLMVVSLAGIVAFVLAIVQLARVVATLRLPAERLSQAIEDTRREIKGTIGAQTAELRALAAGSEAQRESLREITRSSAETAQYQAANVEALRSVHSEIQAVGHSIRESERAHAQAIAEILREIIRTRPRNGGAQ